MKQFLIVFFSTLLSITSFSQSKEEVSHLSFGAISDSINKYAYSDIIKAVDASNSYILKAKRKGDKLKEWKGIYSIGSIYEQNQEFEKAQVYFEKSLEFAEKNKLQEEVIGSYFLGAQIQMALSNGSQTLEILDNALSLAEEIDSNYWKENILEFISYILSMTGDMEKAIKIRKKTISMYENRSIDSVYTSSVKTTTLTNAYSQLSRSYLKVKEADSAKYYSGLISKLISSDDSCNQRTLYQAKGEIYFFEKDFAEARKSFKTASELCDPNIPLLALRLNYSLGKVEHGDGKFKEAKTILQQALDNYVVKPSEEGFMDDYYKLLADSYKEIGDLKNANYYFEKYIHSTSKFDKIKSEVQSSTNAQEIEKFRSELKSLEEEKNTSERKLYYLLLGASVIILMLLFFLLRFYRNKKANETKFQALLAKIESAPTSEEIIDTKDSILEETNSSDVSEEVKMEILQGLKKLEEKEYFLKQECNSYNVAKKIGTNTSYLSKVINSHYGKNFNTYINDLRINYAILRLKNDVIFRSYSIQSIAEELGYKSADSFSKYFKKDTGLNPSFYIKEIKNIV